MANREVSIMRQVKIRNKIYYEEIDYWNYLTGQKERNRREKMISEIYPNDALFFWNHNKIINYHLAKGA